MHVPSRLLAALVAASDDAIYVVSRDGLIMDWNQGAERLFGYTEAEAAGRPITMLAPPSHQGEVRHLLDKLRRLGCLPPIETVRLRKDGRLVQVSLTLSAVHGADGAVEAFLAIARDVSDRRALEATLRRGEATLQALADAIPEAIVFTGADGRIVSANRSTERIFGRTGASLAGATLDLLVAAAAPPPAGWRQALREGKPLVGRRADGTAFPAEVSVSAPGAPAWLHEIAVIRDVGEAMHQAAELVRARELAALRDHVFSSISHEVKTPLSVIQGYAELLQDRYPDEALLRGLMEGTERLTTQLNAIIDYAALFTGAMPLYRIEVRPAEIVEALPELVAPRCRAKDVAFALDVAPDLPPLFADPRRVAQLLLALLDNAVRFTPAGGKLGLAMREAGRELLAVVWDTGPGIAPEHRGRVWDAFGQTALGDAGRTGGVGLGLPIAAKIAELHGGRIDLDSEPGHGCAFTVHLPLAPQREDADRPATASRA